MPTIGFNLAFGYTEHKCDLCGSIVPFSSMNFFGECEECAKEIEGEAEVEEGDNQ